MEHYDLFKEYLAAHKLNVRAIQFFYEEDIAMGLESILNSLPEPKIFGVDNLDPVPMNEEVIEDLASEYHLTHDLEGGFESYVRLFFLKQIDDEEYLGFNFQAEDFDGDKYILDVGHIQIDPDVAYSANKSDNIIITPILTLWGMETGVPRSKEYSNFKYADDAFLRLNDGIYEHIFVLSNSKSALYAEIDFGQDYNIRDN